MTTTNTIIDPTDSALVATALVSYLTDRLGPGTTLVQPPSPLGQGFDTHIYSFRADGTDLPPSWRRDLVLRLYGSAEQSAKCEREAAIQRFVATRGFPAVEPLAVDALASPFGLPIMIMPKVDGGTLLDHLKSHPLRARRLLREMGRLHASLHTLPTDGSPLPYDAPLITRILAESRGRVDAAGASHMEDGLRWIASREHLLRDETPVLCHNDYHPLNILVDGGTKLHVIDWSNAAIGDRHCDVARTIGLFWFAQIVAGSTAERLLLRALRGFLRRNYLRGYREIASLDAKRLALWETVHTFGGWAQLEELAAIRATGASTTTMAQQIPPSMTATARARFWTLAHSIT